MILLSTIDRMPRTTLADLHPSFGAENMVKPQNEDLKKDFRLSIDLPGVKVNDLQITVEQDVLHIDGFRRIFTREGDTTKRSRFSYTVAVDEDADLTGICANLSDGVLVITAPRKPRPEPIIVPISTELHEAFTKKSFETKETEMKEKSKERSKAKEIEVNVQPSVNQQTAKAAHETT